MLIRGTAVFLLGTIWVYANCAGRFDSMRANFALQSKLLFGWPLTYLVTDPSEAGRWIFGNLSGSQFVHINALLNVMVLLSTVTILWKAPLPKIAARHLVWASCVIVGSFAGLANIEPRRIENRDSGLDEVLRNLSWKEWMYYYDVTFIDIVMAQLQGIVLACWIGAVAMRIPHWYRNFTKKSR